MGESADYPQTPMWLHPCRRLIFGRLSMSGSYLETLLSLQLPRIVKRYGTAMLFLLNFRPCMRHEGWWKHTLYSYSSWGFGIYSLLLIIVHLNLSFSVYGYFVLGSKLSQCSLRRVISIVNFTEIRYRRGILGGVRVYIPVMSLLSNPVWESFVTFFSFHYWCSSVGFCDIVF